jgi:hypothetical protein
MAFAFIITILFCIGGGDDEQKALTAPTPYPILTILTTSTKSTGAITTLMTLVLLIGLIATFSTLTSVSRLTWVFTQNKGLPFHKFFAWVGKKHACPSS